MSAVMASRLSFFLFFYFACSLFPLNVHGRGTLNTAFDQFLKMPSCGLSPEMTIEDRQGQAVT